ncbi:hypothetical protein BDY19DRAFT_211695 [Irpex rosettiformis]|uniref:Uncharacterized protein n=1 Tax=Irpex rosettiformis TaxID=378272 RepID=A0ACB8U171_9APHY|nr:hypothetical protein BDY19DRAFT_211695 [Irpex rosettiformis]
MVTNTSTIPTPVYEPVQYALTGRPFKLLPPLARHYLADVIGVIEPKNATPRLIQDHRDALKCTFFRTLQGNDEWLVKDWRTVQKLRPIERRGIEQAMQLVKSEEQFLHILLPERENHFREFVGKFDALVWLELEGRRGNASLTEAQQKEYRDEMCGLREALDYPRKALEALDRQVVGMLEERENSPVKTYFEQNVFPVSSPRDVNKPGSDRESKGAVIATRHHVGASWRSPRSHEGRRSSGAKGYGLLYSMGDRKKRSTAREGALSRNKSPVVVHEK